MSQAPYLKVTILEDSICENDNIYSNRNIPFANSELIFASISEINVITSGNDVNRVYDIKLNLGEKHDFFPGDTVGILPNNEENEVNNILVRLNLESVANKKCNLSITENTNKKSPIIPKHLPQSSSLLNIFRHFIDVRNPPKKLYLKKLAEYTNNPEEKRELLDASNPKNSEKYSNLILGKGRTLLGLLNLFPSCQPPVELILENSSPLQPRPYSISSSPLVDKSLHITFYVIENDDGSKGVCTGWLENVMNNKNGFLVPLYFRKPNNFRMPLDLSVPIIMIATGTGITPFQGFLQHRELALKTGENIGDSLLFYGCRYANRDCLYKNKIQSYLESKVLSKFYLACSRDSDSKHYVQHKIKEHSVEFMNFIIDKKAIVYVCGDFKTMVKDVKNTVVSVIMNHLKLSEEEAINYMKKLETEKRYIIDTWI